MSESTTTTTTPLSWLKQVTIIGAGVAGLTLARLLQLKGGNVRVYEADASCTARDQGGCLDLRAHSGQRAVREAGLEDSFRSLSRPEGQSMVILDRHGSVHFTFSPETEDFSKPEIDRLQLRELFLNSLKPGTVAWGHKVVRIDPNQEGGHTVEFQDGTTINAEFLVGCDGAWSKVRKLISPLEPIYTGVTFFETRFADPEGTCAEFAALTGNGSLMALSHNKGILSQRNGDGSIRIYVCLRTSEDWATRKGIDISQHEELKAALLEEFAGWSPTLLDTLHKSDNFVHRPLFELPADPQWTTKPGLAVLGDAAHLISPFAGEGANLAMLDAVELANCLTSESFPDATAAVRAFEQSMFARAEKAAKKTHASLNACLAPEAPSEMVAFINQLKTSGFAG